MKNHTKTAIAILAICAMLLSGCSVLENMPKPPKVTAAPAETPAPAAETAAPQATVEPEPAAQPAELAVPNHGMLIHLERTTKEAFDPAEGKFRILTFAWDSLKAESDRYPEAAAAITEKMAALQDAWYTGNGSSEYDIYGYNNMLAAAEDNFAIMQEYGDLPECSATRYISVLRADDDMCVFLVNTYIYLGGAHGSYSTEAICFDAKSGARLTIGGLSPNEEDLRAKLLSEMLRLAKEDRDGYYSDRISLTDPADYEAAFQALIRDGSWYPDEDGFHLFSELYELGPYAAGITDFVIPYDSLIGLLDPRWIPKPADTEVSVKVLPLSGLEEGSMEIVDRIAVGDGGEAFLITFDGTARNVEICTAYFADRFYEDEGLFFCGELQNCALQLALLFPGDMPNTMLRYRDSAGMHEYMIALSGKDGSIILAENL